MGLGHRAWFRVILYDPDWFPFEGARTVSIYVGLACMALAMVPAIFCRSAASDEGAEKSALPPGPIAEVFKDLFQGVVITFKNKPFQKICIATFCIFNAYNCVAGFAFIIVYYMHGSDPWRQVTGRHCSAAFPPVHLLFVIPVINWMAQRYGKRETFPITQSVSLAGYAMFW